MLVPSLGWKDPLEEEMQSAPASLPGESHGQRSLAGYSPLGLLRVAHDGNDLAQTCLVKMHFFFFEAIDINC